MKNILIFILLISFYNVNANIIKMYSEIHLSLENNTKVIDFCKKKKSNIDIHLQVSDLVLCLKDFDVISPKCDYYSDYRINKLNTNGRDTSQFILYFSRLNNNTIYFRITYKFKSLNSSRYEKFFSNNERIDGVVSIDSINTISNLEIYYEEGNKTFSGPTMNFFPKPSLDKILLWGKYFILSKEKNASNIIRKTSEVFFFKDYNQIILLDTIINSNFLLDKNHNVYFLLMKYKGKNFLLSCVSKNNSYSYFFIGGEKSMDKTTFSNLYLYDNYEKNEDEFMIQVFNKNHKIIKIFLNE